MAKVLLEKYDCTDGNFPEVCLKCGRPAGHLVKTTLAWMPPWVYLTILIHFLLFLIVASIMRKTVKARLPMCHEHRNHWFWRPVIIVGSIPVIVAGLVGLGLAARSMPGNQGETLLLVSIFGSILLWIAAAVALSLTAIRATKIDERGIRLTGVSEEFVNAYEGHVRQYRPQVPDLDEQIARRWNERLHGPSGQDEEPGRYRREQDEHQRRGKERIREMERPRNDDPDDSSS